MKISKLVHLLIQTKKTGGVAAAAAAAANTP